MKIIIDSAIPYINGVLEPFAEVVYKKGTEINHCDVQDCDAMIIRTRTKCNEQLLKESKVKFIGTATIGFDHIDTTYCKANSIEVATAAGCNAMGVVHYLLAALIELQELKTYSTIGIIGVGNVGGALQHVLTEIGFNVLVNDPPRAERENNFISTPLDELLTKSDVVTIHTPLTKEGKYPTYEMADSAFFKKLGNNKIFINASRGETVNEKALLTAIKNGVIAVIDVWHNEPEINREICEMAFISTPHIAGYSEQGKANGTAMMIKALCDCFNIKGMENWYPEGVIKITNGRTLTLEWIMNRMTHYYQIKEDNKRLKEDVSKFEEIRNNYKYRKEFF